MTKHNEPFEYHHEEAPGTDWIAVFFAVIVAVAVTLALADLVFGAEEVTYWLAGLV